MAELKRTARQDLDPELGSLHDLLTGAGVDARFVEVGANAPEIVDWYFNSFYKQVFYGGRVEPKIKELLRLKLSKTHGCVL